MFVYRPADLRPADQIPRLALACIGGIGTLGRADNLPRLPSRRGNAMTKRSRPPDSTRTPGSETNGVGAWLLALTVGSGYCRVDCPYAIVINPVAVAGRAGFT